MQVFADVIKIFFKEDWVPPFADKAVFIMAPGILIATILFTFAVIPFTCNFIVLDSNIGLLFFLGNSSLGVYSIVLGGWASNNKYSLLGSIRASAQMLTYEVFMGLSLVGVVMMADSFSLREIVEAQRNGWFVIPQFIGFVIFFIVGIESLSALPLVTAGFYSKDQILWLGWSAASGSGWLWLAGISGALLTSVYTFRLIFIAFFGAEKLKPAHRPGLLMTMPLAILAFLSIVAGFTEIPENMGKIHLFSSLLGNSLPGVAIREGGPPESLLQLLSAIISVFGIWLAYNFFYKRSVAGGVSGESRLIAFFRSGWGFDKAYELLFVKPVVWLSEINKKDFADSVFSVITRVMIRLHLVLGMTQNGRLRYYALVFTAGLVIIIAFLLSS